MFINKVVVVVAVAGARPDILFGSRLSSADTHTLTLQRSSRNKTLHTSTRRNATAQRASTPDARNALPDMNCVYKYIFDVCGAHFSADAKRRETKGLSRARQRQQQHHSGQRAMRACERAMRAHTCLKWTTHKCARAYSTACVVWSGLPERAASARRRRQSRSHVINMCILFAHAAASRV